MPKINLEDIRVEAECKGWMLESNSYENLDTPLEFTCGEGHHIHLPYKKVRGKEKWECPVCKANVYYERKTEVKPKPKGAKRVLGLDQATHISGYSIFEDGKLVAYGSFLAQGATDIERDCRIREWLISMVTNWDIDYCGVEGIQYQQAAGVTTFQALARLQGVVLEALHSFGIQYEICPTNTWRNQMGVRGRARADRKRSAKLIVKDLYDVTVTEDEADAILIGGYASQKQGSSLVIE